MFFSELNKKVDCQLLNISVLFFYFHLFGKLKMEEKLLKRSEKDYIRHTL